jgi:hypothetical protein
MNYAVEMSSGTMIYIPSFKKIGSGIQSCWEGDKHCGHTDIDKHGDLISLLLFFQNRVRRLKIEGRCACMSKECN